ncbi:MAG: YlmC/YmxH family sporulation protein [Peptococcaceae bacterium]|jgi:YlmC/YmxH family sporulation protein|nr:YlmC/YmxH family sporulation protein [Peptococcaceae bacterium]
MVKISDLRLREIVNIMDGRRLGMIKDIEIDMDEGRITAFILPGDGGGGKFLGLFGREEEIIVPWEKIKKIGMDVILVEVPNFAEPRHEYKFKY